MMKRAAAVLLPAVAGLIGASILAAVVLATIGAMMWVSVS